MGCENLEAFLKRLTRKLRNSNVEVWPARQARVQPIPLLMPVYPTGSVYSSQAREEIGEHRRRGDTYDVAHFAMRARTRGNRWTGECKQTRRMSKLLSPMHPLFRFLCSSVPVLTLPPMPGPTQLSLADARTLSLSLSLFLSPSLRFHLYGQPRSSVSRLPSCDNPTPPCVNSCTHKRADTLRESIPRAGNVYLA
jgi:hypothetical protein